MKNIKFKNPVSVLVVIYTIGGQVLLLERADMPGFWQSVTGSQEDNETLMETAQRELFEETSLRGNVCDWKLSNTYEIYDHWRWRYAPEVSQNIEHVFGLCLESTKDIKISLCEHLQYVWLNWEEAAKKVFSPSNAEAIHQVGKILSLPESLKN